jgi:hypothetical protein
VKRYALITFCHLLRYLRRGEGHSNIAKQIITLNHIGVIALNRKDWQVALQDFEAALKLDPTYPLVQHNRLALDPIAYLKDIFSQPAAEPMSIGKSYYRTAGNKSE